MKTLTKYLNEKLIINKNFKNIDDIQKLFANIGFKHDRNNLLATSDDIFSIMVDYIRDHNIRSFSDFDSYKKTSQDSRYACLAVFNKNIKEIDIFKKIVTNEYKVFIIFKRSYMERYIFHNEVYPLAAMHVLKNTNTWTNVDDVEYYEISKETFNDIKELYDNLDE